MKKLLFIFAILFTRVVFGGTIKGAWEMQPEGSTSNEKVVMIASEKYLTIAVFEKNVFVRTYGGSYELNKDGLILKLEFDSKSKESVGTTVNYKFSRANENTFSIENQAKTSWKRLDNGKDNLAGYWRITQREGQDGKMNPMPFAARRTIKMLSEGRFQWIAINAETGEFFGTGGGNYTLKDGKYTENIEFFSRDNSRVGASLSFDYKLEGNNWQHSGKSSTGSRVNEIWSRE